jgi:hypothetical protein
MSSAFWSVLVLVALPGVGRSRPSDGCVGGLYPHAVRGSRRKGQGYLSGF